MKYFYKIDWKMVSRTRLYILYTQEVRYKLTRSHFNAQILPNQSEQRCGELDSQFIVQWHIHTYKFFVGKTVGTLVTESQRRIHIFQHIIHFRIMNSTTISINIVNTTEESKKETDISFHNTKLEQSVCDACNQNDITDRADENYINHKMKK